MSLELDPGVRIRRVPEFPDYSITTDGQVLSHKHGRTLVMKARTSKTTGYPGVSLCRQGEIVSRNVHTLVASAFMGERPEGQVVRHLDGDPLNNRLSNLRYGTYADNEADKERHGRRPKGEAVYGSKMKPEDVLDIRRMYADGVWMGHIRKKYKLNPTTMHRLIHGSIWGHLPVPDYSRRPPRVYPPNFRPRHKLTEAQVMEIKAKIRKGARLSELAREYGVTPSAINHLDKGSTWKTVA